MSNVSPQSSARPATRTISTLLIPIALAILTLVSLLLLWEAFTYLAALLRYPYPHDGLEGTLLHEARLWWGGEPLYQPLTTDRFVSAPYPPLHPLILGLADRVTGPHVFWSGRVVSLVAALGIALMIVLIVRRAAKTWAGGLLGATLFLSAPPVILWATRVKPDLMALLLTTLGLYLASRATEDRGWRMEDGGSTTVHPPSSSFHPLSVVASAVCFTLAFFTKQTAVAAPLAVGLALLATDLRAFRRTRAGYIGRLPLRWSTLIFGLSYAVLTLGTWLVLDLSTGGQFTAHVWGLHRSEWWSSYLLSKFVVLLAPYWPAGLFALALLTRAAQSGRGLVPACYALVVPITLLGAGETGANHNHLLESLLALALAVGIAAGWAAELPLRALPTSLGVVGLLVAQLYLAVQPQPWYDRELVPGEPPERFISLIRSTSGEVLTDDVGLLFAAGRPLRYDDPSTMGPAATSGVWDQRGLLREIAERRFSAILIPIDVEEQTADPAGRWTPEMIAAIREHYRVAYRDSIYTYVPREQN
jgi:hypothetical protein